MQHSKINDHFFSLINYINTKKYYSDPHVLSYLIGQICHYSLDVTAHPYIIYYSGSYNNKIKDTYKYNGVHEKMELAIDNYFIQKREKIECYKFKIHKEVFSICRFDKALMDTINTVMKEVYNIDGFSDIYYKSLVDMKRFYFIFNYDRWGIKKSVYKIMDFICRDRFIKKESLSFHIDIKDTIKYLNHEKKEWNHPCDINEKYNYSFEELYDIAIDKAVNIINSVYNMLEKGKIDERKINNLFNNLDYSTGKDCNGDYNIKYFRFLQ